MICVQVVDCFVSNTLSIEAWMMCVSHCLSRTRTIFLMVPHVFHRFSFICTKFGANDWYAQTSAIQRNETFNFTIDEILFLEIYHLQIHIINSQMKWNWHEVIVTTWENDASRKAIRKYGSLMRCSDHNCDAGNSRPLITNECLERK